MTAIGRFTFTWSSGLNEVGPAVKSSLLNLLNSAERAAPSNDLARSAASLKASIVEAPVIRPPVAASWPVFSLNAARRLTTFSFGSSPNTDAYVTV